MEKAEFEENSTFVCKGCMEETRLITFDYTQVVDSIAKGLHIDDLVSETLARMPSPSTTITFALRGKLALLVSSGDLE